MVFTQRLHPYWLAFMVLEGAMHITRGKKKALISHSCEPVLMGGNLGLQW